MQMCNPIFVVLRILSMEFVEISLKCMMKFNSLANFVDFIQLIFQRGLSEALKVIVTLNIYIEYNS